MREAPGPDLHEIGAPPAGAPAPLTADGAMDFAALYQQAGLPATPFTAEQMVEMLANLPKELALDAKRATVKATLSAVGKSIGATPETIVTDASRKLAALTAYVEHLAKQTADDIAQRESGNHRACKRKSPKRNRPSMPRDQQQSQHGGSLPSRS